MWVRAFSRPALAAVSVSLLASPAGATTIEYTLAVRPDEGVVDVSYVINDYPYETIALALSHTPMDPGEFVQRFVDAKPVTTRDGRDLPPDPVSPGVVRFGDVDGEVRGGYVLKVGELNAALGTGSHLPLVTSERCVLPIGAMLTLPVEIDTRGLDFYEFAVRFVLPDGWSLVTPWSTYGGRVSWREEWQESIATGIVCAGDVQVIDELETRSERLLVTSGLDAEQTSAVGDVLLSIFEGFTAVFGTSAGGASVFVVEASDAVDIRNFGRYLRVQAPAHLLKFRKGDPITAELREYLLILAHETGHRWVGAFGMLKPLGGEVFWVTEGAHDYVAAGVLDASFESDETVPWLLSRCVNRLRELPIAGDPIDRSATFYGNHADYRKLVRAKGPLASFLLDVELREAGSERSFAKLLRSLFYRTFMRGESAGMAFGPADLAATMNENLGIRGKLVLNAILSGDILPDVGDSAARAGLVWENAADGSVRLAWSDEPGLLTRE